MWPARVIHEREPDVEVVVMEPTKGDSGLMAWMDGNDRVVNAACPEDADVVVFQRPSFPQLVHSIPHFRKRGVAVVVDIDDDLSAIDPRNPAFTALHPDPYSLLSDAEVAAMVAQSGQRWPEGWSRGRVVNDLLRARFKVSEHSWEAVKDAARMATICTVSTPALAERYGRGNVVVLPNCVPARFCDTPRQDSDVIGWPGSTHSHPGDLRVMGNAIARLGSAGFPFKVVGDGAGADRDLGVPAVEQTGPIPFDGWIEAVAQIGVGVTPLADTRFNAAKCLDAETRIATRRGIVRIADIEVGDSVWRHGRWVMVEAVEAQPPRPGLAIVAADGRELRLTAEHRLMVNGRWTVAGLIRPGDSVALSPDEFGADALATAPWPSDGRSSRGAHDRQAFIGAEDAPVVRITERWARLLGLFTGDGSIAGTAVNISCDGQDADLIDLLTADLEAIGLWPQTNATRTYDGQVLRRRFVAVSSTHLIRFLRSLGLVEPDRARRVVRVPDVIWRSPRHVVAQYLAGLFEADGTCSERAAPSLTSKHRSLALDVQRLLAGFDIEAFVACRMLKAQTGPARPYWQVRLRRAGADLFVKEVGFLSARKRARLADYTSRPHSNAYRPMTWVTTIASVEACEVTPVDLQVDGSVFAAAGWLSHNSWLKPLELAAAGVPWVASPRVEYARFASFGAGVLADRPKDWYREVGRLCRDAGWRAEQSEAVRAVARMLTIEQHAYRTAEAWHLAVTLERQNRPQGAPAAAAG